MELIKMKHIKTIEVLFNTAIRRASYVEGSIGHASINRFGNPVYEVIINRRTDEAVLKHYGTVTIRYKLREGELLEWYGEGVSDRDSMNTFMACLNEDRYYFRYGTRMGFVMEEGGVRHELVSV
jgi:hypothetical protein